METQLLSEINDKLDKIVGYMNFIAIGQMKQAIPAILDNNRKKLVYHACDGKTGINEISRKTGINAMSVSDYVKQFEIAGIVVASKKDNKKYPQKLTELASLGLELPQTPVQAPQQSQTTPETTVEPAGEQNG